VSLHFYILCTIKHSCEYASNRVNRRVRASVKYMRSGRKRGFMGSVSRLTGSTSASKSHNLHLASLSQSRLIKTRTRHNLTIQLHDNIRWHDIEFAQQVSYRASRFRCAGLAIGKNGNGVLMIYLPSLLSTYSLSLNITMVIEACQAPDRKTRKYQ
jgi:hypothetical protein